MVDRSFIKSYSTGRMTASETKENIIEGFGFQMDAIYSEYKDTNSVIVTVKLASIDSDDPTRENHDDYEFKIVDNAEQSFEDAWSENVEPIGDDIVLNSTVSIYIE